MNPILITLRQLFDDARRRPVSETAVSRIQTTLGLDHCAELALNVVIRDFGAPDKKNHLGGRRDIGWDKLWSLADEVARANGLSAGLPNLPALKTLHETRNLTQHRGIIPSLEDARAAIEPVRQLLASIYSGLYGADFERIQSWDGLACTTLRDWLADCHAATEAGYPDVGIVGCKIAYDRIIQCVRSAALGDQSYHLRVHSTLTGLPSDMRHALDALREAAERLDAQIVAIGIGLSLADHHRFVRSGLGVHVSEMMAGNFSITFSSPWNPYDKDKNLDAARFMLSYLAHAALTLESSYPGAFASFAVRQALHRESFWPEELRGSESNSPA